MKNSIDHAVVCLSGGMDSTSLLLHLLTRGRNVYGISFDYGQKHSVELSALQRNIEYLRSAGIEFSHVLMDLRTLGTMLHSALTDPKWDVPQGHYEADSMRETVVPNRNAIFASIAYALALSVAKRKDARVNLSLGVHSGDHAIYPDCRPEFYDELMRAFQTGNWDSDKVLAYLPYLEWDKARILNDAVDSCAALSLDFDTVFANTSTSYLPDADGRAHGLTGADVERILAFHSIGRRDPIDYAQPWDAVLKTALELQEQHRQSSS